jgi:starvation-inducible DNA-binding protein
MAKQDSSKQNDLKRRRIAPLITPTDLGVKASKDIAGGMNGILADVFALYLKTKNFHWHMSGPHFRDYHLLLDEQADQLYAMTDPIAERIRKTGGSTLRSIGHIARVQRIKDNDADYVEPLDMLAELREVHDVVDEHRDIATASLIENWIDETERRTWFLFESSRRGDKTGH